MNIHEKIILLRNLIIVYYDMQYSMEMIRIYNKNVKYFTTSAKSINQQFFKTIIDIETKDVECRKKNKKLKLTRGEFNELNGIYRIIMEDEKVKQIFNEFYGKTN